jgi:23S rRNA U2552 (ribose-2'-O)-methylase RlmE/FtsJ
VLTRLPFIASVCSHSAAEVAAAFVLACEIAAADAGKVKLSAPTSLRRTLLDAVLRSPVASSLVTTGETLTFQVARCFGAAYFYDSEAVPPWCPSADSLESSLGPSEQHGHWHSANALDKSGAKLSVCRAFYKLSEVFHEEPSFRSALTDAVRGSACIDIGASPGGWTDLLSRHARVVAVDPGDLEAEIACRPSVVHLRRLVGSDADSDDAIRCALRPALAADFVVCDANIAPSDAASLLAHLAASGLLAAGCKVVLTLKAQCKVRGGLQGQCTRRRLESEAVAALGSSFEGVRVRHLFANTQHETTLTALFTGAQHGASEQQRAGTVLSRAIQGQGAACSEKNHD